MSFREKCFNAAGMLFTSVLIVCIFSLALSGFLAPVLKQILLSVK